MTTSVRMDEDQNQMTERIFNLTLEIIYLLTRESFSSVKSGDHVTILVPQFHSLISDGHNKQKILEIIRKMVELLTGEVPMRCQDVTIYFSKEEGQYVDRHQDLYKDTMMENQPPLTSPGVSSNRNPPERCAGPLYSQNDPQEDPSIPHHFQGGELMHVNAVVKEEEEEIYLTSDQQSMMEGDMKGTIKEETYVRSDQQPMEEGDMKETIKEEMNMRSDQQSIKDDYMMRTIREEEEETNVRRVQQSMEDGDVMRTIKKEEEETYVRSDQQFTEEGDMMRTIKEEENETNVRSDRQSMEEGDMMRTIKEEEETYVRSDQQSMEEDDMMGASKKEDIITDT
ncbi:gastrula zinc finger protein XlCGF66.1-like [Hyperolius riggenbachi]|uniref:gastrula zinc finger protein XlCGF66.1-like n=1 Tax=Hyperolius riggenbachi TaxID=752182 RepID=UPI0035A3B0ED